MRRELIAPTIALGLGISLAGCGNSNKVPADVTAAAAHITREYGCPGTPDISIEDISGVSDQTFGNSDTGLAYTDTKGIHLSSKESVRTMASLVTHETLHWCADRKTSRQYSSPYEVGAGNEITGSTGFVPILNGEQQQSGPTHVEEGVVEWVARQEAGYQPHREYDQLAKLTGELARLRGFDARTVIDLLKQDNLVGYVALATDRPADAVDGQAIYTLVQTYIDAYNNKSVPTEQQLRHILGE